ncbi:hypothetical protein I5677_04095 [Mobilitalea sibirica]|uniref:Uncharacterized protein n=1 Tax=Mobilitalea sibirica TaxID=1462919 RepID=A0A8J7HAL6_9FIRM|nr:hypothetical protein [Mobilitalea sibirica]MBH1940076.1 hypothetical protein [Mobilitalea sibirica]
MSKTFVFIRRNLSALIFLTIYIVLAVVYIFLEGFLPDNQFILLTTMLPLIILGGILDYILSKNSELVKSYKTFAQILPSGFLLLFLISAMIDRIGRNPIEAFEYIYIFFITVPFFIASYHKEGHKERMKFSLTGLAFMVAVYMWLTTQTNYLLENSYVLVYFFSYFMMFYAASCIYKAAYISTILGILNSITLLVLRYFPFTAKATFYGWDRDIFQNFEILMLSTFTLCILLRLFASVYNSRTPNQKPQNID